MRDYRQTYVAEQDPHMQQIPVSDTAGVLKSVNLISVLVGVLLAIGMIADQHSITTSVLVGGAVYGLVAILLIVFQPGGLPWIIVNGQNQKTLRLNHAQEHKVHMTLAQSQVSLVPPLHIPSARPAQPLALPQAPNYVSAVPPADERLKLGSYQFVRALFDDEGKPIPKRILAEHTRSPGLVQHEKPKPDVVEYLTGLQMVWTNERKQLFFNVRDYPSLRYCITAIKLGYPAGREGVPPSNTPQLQESGGVQ